MKWLQSMLILAAVQPSTHCLDVARFSHGLQNLDGALGADSGSDVMRRHLDLIHNPPPLTPAPPAQRPVNPQDELLDAIRAPKLKKSHSEQKKEEELDYAQKARIARRKALGGDDESDDDDEWPDDAD